MARVAVGAKDTTFPKLGAEGRGAPALSVNEELRDRGVLLLAVTVVELEHSRVSFSTSLAAAVSSIAQ
jgi:hypothetical protein